MQGTWKQKTKTLESQRGVIPQVRFSENHSFGALGNWRLLAQMEDTKAGVPGTPSGKILLPLKTILHSKKYGTLWTFYYFSLINLVFVLRRMKGGQIFPFNEHWSGSRVSYWVLALPLSNFVTYMACWASGFLLQKMRRLNQMPSLLWKLSSYGL